MPRTKAASTPPVKAVPPPAKKKILKEDNPFVIYYEDHEPRTDSPLYAQSRKLMNAIAQSTSSGKGAGWFYGPPSWEDHHGGGLWVHDGKGWFFVKNFAGMEWASQFCADPAKVDQLRQNAKRLYQGDFYTNTKSEVARLQKQYPFDDLLNTAITDSKGIALWCDSIFNASVPLPRLRHTGLNPKGHGVHHYPTPITDIELFKHGDFVLWVIDAEGAEAAVVPVHPRGVSPDDPRYKKNYGKTAVTFATPGTKLATRLKNAGKKQQQLMIGATDPMTEQAFQEQVTPKTAAKKTVAKEAVLKKPASKKTAGRKTPA
ncbi:DUF6424 family protein [Undibacterium sp. TJN25]|uniref:DUF6424 family protein n=1 Tax=Undibacterium sp. TJN25 TaxID=3413056 RepID=UPI003BF24BD1